MGKHILNDPKTLVSDALQGLAYSNPSTVLDLENTTLLLRDLSPDRVHLICGGGAGHEPAHAGFVAEGMLSAAVSGQVFASPNSRQVEKVLDRLGGSKGCLIITKNYTGDVIQFGLARERWTATHPGKDSVRMVVVGEDVAVSRSQGALTGRRGLAATVLVYKIAGALAAKGASLDEVTYMASLISENSGTIGIGLDHTAVPGNDSSGKHLGDDELELGLGIHNEPGIRRISPMPSAEKLVAEMLENIVDTKDKERGFVPFKGDGGDSVILLVNNLGAIPEVQLSVVVQEASKWLQDRKILVERVLSGSFVTSLSLPGFSISLVLLPRGPVSNSPFKTSYKFDTELILSCVDAPTNAPGWKWHHKGRPDLKLAPVEKAQKVEESSVKGPKITNPKLFLAAIKAAMVHVIAAEKDITHFDTVAGDGDAGLTLKAGAEGVLEALHNEAISSTDAVQAIVSLSEIVEKKMGGTSGGLYAILLSGVASGLVQAMEDVKSKDATAEVWARSLELGLNTLYRYTLARPPSRTLVDPLAAFVITFGSDPSNFVAAYKAAKEAAEATRSLEALAGRAAYVDREKIQAANIPDAGAYGLSMMLDGVKEGLGL